MQPPGEPATEEGLEKRLRALRALAQQGDTAAVIQALFDADPTVQSTAFDLLLATRDHPEVLAVLIDASKNAQPETRAQALRLLHETAAADEGTILSTLGGALADAGVHVKSYAIQGLADRAGAEAIEALRQALRDPDPAVRMLVLEHVSPQDHGLALLQEVLADDDATVRSFASSMLEEVTVEK